jgi:hypothetical protein
METLLDGTARGQRIRHSFHFTAFTFVSYTYRRYWKLKVSWWFGFIPFHFHSPPQRACGQNLFPLSSYFSWYVLFFEVPVLCMYVLCTYYVFPVVDTVDGEGSGEGTTTEAENNESGSSGVKEIDPNDCFLAKSRGPCRAVIDSWFFNVATKSCEPFSWSGCGGNSNRFPEKLLCESQCSKPAGAGTTGEVPKNVSDIATSSTSTSAPTSTSSTARPVLTTKHKLPDCPKFDGCPDKCVIIQDRSDRGCKKCLCGSPNEAENKNRVPGPTQVSSGNNVTIVKAPEISVGSVSGLPDADSIDEDDLPIVGT